MYRQSLRWVLFAATVPLLMAMGGGGGGPASDTIPRPKENFSADLVDRQGTTTRVEFLSCGGKTFLPLTRGDGTLMVPFAKVAQLTFGAESGKQVEVSVGVEGGKALEGSLSTGLVCTGSTDYGNYQIPVQGLREIRIVRP